MKGAWAALLVLGMVSAARPAGLITHQQAITSAVDLYNQQANSSFAFRLLEAEAQPDWDPTGRAAQGLKFTIKETVCPAAQRANLSQCEFKEDGVDQDCSGIYSGQPDPPTVSVQCEDIDQELNRITRSRWRRFRRKVGRFLKQH